MNKGGREGGRVGRREGGKEGGREGVGCERGREVVLKVLSRFQSYARCQTTDFWGGISLVDCYNLDSTKFTDWE